MTTQYDLCVELARKNDLDGLKRLKDMVVFYKVAVLDIAVENGHLDILKWLLYEKIYLDTNHVVLDIVLSRKPFQRHLADWLYLNGYYNKTSVSSYFVPVTKDCREAIEWLIEHDCARNKLIIELAAEKGLFDLMKFLHSQNFPITSSLYISIINFGDENSIELLDWLYNIHPKMPSWIVKNIIEKNRLRILKWYIGKGYKIDLVECKEIAKQNQSTAIYNYLMTL